MNVAQWLNAIDLGQYEAVFREHEIDAGILRDLVEADLEKIGVPLGHRKRLLRAIAALGTGETAVKPPSPAPASSTATAERRPITVMFCDLVGSTSMAAKLDAEDWRTLVNTYLDEASAAVTRLGGHVLKKLGDGLMALFGYPHAQENDAERAVRAALAIQRGLVEINARNASRGTPELQVRIGLDSGQVVVDATGEVFGDAPNIAARVQSAGGPGSILITATVQRQTAGLFVAEDRGEHELKGVSAPMTLYRVVRASGGGRRGGARALTPLVGREEELDLLARRWERARKGEGQLALIVGEPGLGKSRLMEEFHGRLGETPHTWVEWSSSQLLQNTPLHPIAEWGRQRFGADLPTEQRLADLEHTLRLIGLDPTEYAPLLAPLVDVLLPEDRVAKLAPEELRRRQLAAMIAWILEAARTQAVVLAFEDLHWADPTSLDLLRALAERGAQAPLLIVATARPEFRPPWSVRSHHSAISLSPLDRMQIGKMVSELSAHHALPREIVESVSTRTGGVPLFVEEVTRLLLERGEQGGAQPIPPTLQQSLAARLDRLGTARETALIGAVLGRGFSYALLQSVADLDEGALQSALERVAEADILFVEGHGAQATYRFKHALIQDAAYDSLLKSRRQALHRRAAEALVKGEAEPEAIAHHFTEAGLNDLGIEWWGKAGDQALRRSAFQEAIAHLGKAIDMADMATGAASRPNAGDATASRQRVKLQAGYSEAVMYHKGFSAEETRVAWARAAELGANRDDFSERSSVRHGQWTLAIVRGELHAAQELASTFLREAEDAGRPVEAGVARRSLGIICYYFGDFLNARIHCERALDECRHERDLEARERFSDDTGAVAMSILAITSWQLGEVERANELINMANHRAAELGHAPSKVHPLYWKSILEILRGDAAAALVTAKALEDLCGEHGMGEWGTVAEMVVGWAHGRLANPTAGAVEMRQALAVLINKGGRLLVAFFQGLLADLELETLGADSAVARIDEALVSADQATNFASLPFLHRLRGDILLKRNPRDMAPAEDAYRTAIAVAKQQAARSYELLASLALAKLYQSTGRPADAHAVLAPALEGFSLTPEMPEIAEAQALLAALMETDEVKAGASRRQQHQRLHVAYGNALIAARGIGAPETTEAFARAREGALGDKDAPERLAVHYGLWAGSSVRGDLPEMRAHAEAFLNDVEARPDSPEAGVAHRAAGLTCWFAGDYRGARDQLQRALILFEPGRDDDLAFRFGLDPGVAAMGWLAIASWPLGNVDRAISLIDRMQTRMANLTHVGTLANGRMYAALFELLRGDRARVALNTLELVRLAQEYDLNLWHAFGVFLEGWVSAASGASGSGLEGMRHGVELLREQNALWFDGLLKMALAEAEAQGGDPGRAVAILDEALATCDRAGYRAFEAELHRARGEMLLKRDPANPAPGEEAFLTAIGVAKQQGTRSFELRAAIALAKLYQSTGRPLEAHGVLALPLEGFAPTPEMPEIDEAQVLLAALAETDEVKAAEAHRQRRVHLQTAYGQAMMWAKGFSADETKAAFSRATALTAKTDSFADRFATAHFQWTLNFLRGELRSARELESSFLKEAEDTGRVVEAGVALRGLALACYQVGDFLGAQTHCERALKVCELENERETQERFHDATGPIVLSVLAVTMWQLGEVERARDLIDQASQRARDLGYGPSMTHPLLWRSHLEILRGDAAAALAAADALAELGLDRGMPFWRTSGEMTAGWARGRLRDAEQGAADLRRALAERAAQGASDGWLQTVLLAELEAKTLGTERALARIEEAMTLASQRENRCNLSFPHLLRGELLLKRSSPSPTAAEEAFQSAIAIAREQGARSWGLRAALALAKLYQSTSRPVEAHAVLAPALEGFSPTMEMPEIAEAQAFLAVLARTDEVKADASRRQQHQQLQATP